MERLSLLISPPNMQTLGLILQVLGLGLLIILIRLGLTAYTAEKGKNLATKEDIAEITHRVESVKVELSQVGAVAEQKRKLKYEACLEALVIIDAHFSHKFISPKPVPQEVNTAKAREAHSKLILSCDDIRIVEKFAEIYFGPRIGQQQRPPTDLLNEFRNLIRGELGFGAELLLDSDRAWIGTSAGDPKSPQIQ